MGMAVKACIEAENDFDITIKDNLVVFFLQVRELMHETNESWYPYMEVT